MTSIKTWLRWRHDRRLACEQLEDRRMLASFLELNGTQTPLPGAMVNVTDPSGIDNASQSEMLIVANPTNPLNLVGLSHIITNPVTLDLYRSFDGGLTWTGDRFDGANDDNLGMLGRRFDPAVAFDANGVLYVVYGYKGQAVAPARPSQLVAATSSDGGVTFGNYQVIDSQADTPRPGTTDMPGVDRWTVTTGRDPISGNQAAVIAYTQNISETSGTTTAIDQRVAIIGTRNGGANWTAPLVINDSSTIGFGTGLAASPAFGPGGFYVTWSDGASIMLDRDADGLWGNVGNFGNDVVVRFNSGLTGFSAPAQPERGVTCSPVLAANVLNNHLYFAVQELVETTGVDSDILFGRSVDFGATWTFSRITNNTGTDFHPQIAVDEHSNALAVAFYTTAGDQSAGNDDVHMRIAVSSDFGNSWTQSDVNAQTSNEAGGYVGDYLEYTGLSFRDGTAHVLWASRSPGSGTDLDAFYAPVGLNSSTNGNILEILSLGGASDSIVVQAAPANANWIEVIFNGIREFAGLASSIDGVSIEARGGVDDISIVGIPPIPVTLTGTSGADTLNIHAFTGASSLSIVAGDGADVINLVPGAPFAVAAITTPITIDAGGGTDILHLGSGNADAVAASIVFDGGSGPGNTVVYDDTSPAYVVAYDVGPGFVVRDGLLNPWTLSYANVQTLAIGAGLSADTFNVHNAPSTDVTIFGNDGNDAFTVGNGNLGIANLELSRLFGGGGVDTLVLDDSAFAGAADWIINSTAVFRGTLGVQEFGYAGFEGVSVLTGLGGSVGDDIAINGPIRVNVAVSGGQGSDSFVLTDVDNYQDFFDQDENPPFHYAMNLDGGGGFNALTVNDAASVDRSYSIWPDRVLVDEGAPLGLDFTYDSFQSVTIQAPSSPVQFGPLFDVYGTSADIPFTHQMSILGTGINDQFVIHPRDSAGNLTINGNLGIGGGGGTDTLTIDDAGSTAPINYSFYNEFGPGTTNMGGLGAGGFGAGSDVENIVVNAGDGDDAFALYSFQAPVSLSVNAGDGVDKFDVAPTAKSLTADVMGMSSFTFDGGPTGYDSFSLFNENNADPWTFTRTAAGIVSHNVATGKTTVWNLPNSEYLNAYGGSQADAFFIEETPTTGPTYNSFLGAGGNDNYVVGRNGRTDLITANIAIVNDAGVDSATIDNSADPTGRTAHVTEFFVAAAVGDNLFGLGGYLYHVNLAGTMTVKMGAGADTVYATPNVSTTVRLEGGNPSAAPGDFLGLGFANVTSPVFTALPSGESQYTFGNASPVTYVGFEQTTIDATAPAVVSQSYAETGLAAIAVQFNDRVSDTPVPIHPYYLEIVNTATSQRIPFENVAVAYNFSTNVATFTFPGYASGRPPAGAYTARVLGGPTDFSGNSMLAQAAFSFMATAPGTGDFNGDGVVGGADLAVWRTSVGVSAAGDTDGDNDTDGADFLTWQRRLGQSTAAPAAQPLAAAARPEVPTWAALDVALSSSVRGPYRPATRRIPTTLPTALGDIPPRRDASRVERRLDWNTIARPSISHIATNGPAGRAAFEAAIDDLLDETAKL